MERLRAILLGCQLTEELKWGKPCYTRDGNNVAILQGFKDACALLFPKGALLRDPHNLLEKPGPNTQAARRIRFDNEQAIADLEPVLTAYIKEAIAAESAGMSVRYKTADEFAMPEELRRKLEEDPPLKAAFSALTPGRQRAYLLHFSAPKQSQTRTARIQRCAPDILNGIGLNDKRQ